ncbi:unnamed protein product [Discula destructiva]
MSQQDLLDTLFLNRKALADASGTSTDTGANGNGSSSSPPGTTTTTKHMMSSSDRTAGTADVCPVDHASREAWLKQAKAASAAAAQQPQDSAHASPASTATQPHQPATSSSWTSGWRIPFFSNSSPASSSSSQQEAAAHQSSLPSKPLNNLGQDREVSTIPRSTAPGATDAACPVNSETETGADASTGNWVYPSEKMFFDAMKRKGHDTRAADMKTVVPIHNAVNERAWVEIKAWERPYEAGTCPGGPRLYSFTGLSGTMSPKARINTLLGYTPPFDRHDWVVDRCGTKVEYVIDFYTGKVDKSGRPSFYLDVRPKLNSWEGVRMRASRILGLV